MHYSMGKLIEGVDNTDALQCLGFNLFDSLCMANNLTGVGYFKTESKAYFSDITKRVISSVDFEIGQYRNGLSRQHIK